MAAIMPSLSRLAGSSPSSRAALTAAWAPGAFPSKTALKISWVFASIFASWFVLSVLIYRLEHRFDVFRRHVWQNVVDSVENKATTRGKDFNILSDMLYDLLGCAAVEDVARVAATTPKGNVAAELLLQLFGLHIAGCDLH